MQKIIFSVILGILTLISALIPSPLYAQNVSVQPQMLTMQMGALSAQGGNISGSIQIINNSQANFAQSYLLIRLISPSTPKTLNANGQNITIQQPGQQINLVKTAPFSLTPGQRSTQNINLTYPETIVSGKYTLTAEIKDQDGSSAGITSQEVSLNGSNSFIMIDPASCRIKIGEVSYGINEGPNVDKNQTASLSCPVKNGTSKDIQIKPQVKYAVNSVGDASASNSFPGSSSLTLAAGQSKTITLDIPSALTPQVYEGFFSLVDNNNVQISSQIVFRWIMSGASAVIKNIDLDKSYYKTGQTAKITLSVLPSMDLSWRGNPADPNPGYSLNAGTDLKNPKVSLKITDQNNQLCGQKEQNLPPTSEQIYWKQIQVDVPLSKECRNPKVEAAVFEEGISTPLATTTKGVVTTPDDLNPIKGLIANKTFKNIWIWLLLLLGVAAAGGFLYWKKRNKKSPPPQSPPSNPPHQPVSPVKQVVAAVIIMVGVVAGYQLFQNQPFDTNFAVFAQQSFSPIQGLEKQPVSTTDASVRTVWQQKLHYRTLNATELNQAAWAQLRPLTWANVRDFAQNNTGGDSQVSVSADCTDINVTVNGTVGSDYMCYNVGPGIAIANFVDSQPITPTNVSSALQNEVIFPSLQINPNVQDPTQARLQANAFNNFATYGPHIIDVHNFGVIDPKSVTYQLKFPTPLAAGEHTLLLQAGASLVTAHNGAIDRYYSSLEPVLPGPTFIPGDTNCDGQSPCYMPLKYTFTCKGPPACNASCSNSTDCNYAPNGCTECRPTPEGQNACQPPPPACGAGCTDTRECFGNKDGCTACVPGATGTGSVCAPPPACGVGCVRDDQCSGATKDGCTVCLPSANGAGSVCSQPPACGVSCTKDDQCAGAKDGCVECAPDATGKNSCQTAFSDAMCKCDGFNALNLQNPSSGKFQFEAFGKVEGADVSRAKITSMKFTLYKSSKSNPNNAAPVASGTIVPQVVSTTDGKVRYRAQWDITPPAFDPNAVYRVGADPKCDRKTASNSASLNFSSNSLVLNSDNGQVLGVEEDLNYTPATLTQSEGLELGTLTDGYFTRITDTDSCRFIKFEYGQY